MSDTLEQLQSMEDLADALVQNAGELKESATLGSTMSELESLQKVQAKLVEQLVELDHKLGELDFKACKDLGDIWERITKKLTEFEQLNEKFIENMSVRQGIVKFEMNEIRESKKSVGKVKKAYARRRPPGNDGKGPKQRLNTLS